MFTIGPGVVRHLASEQAVHRSRHSFVYSDGTAVRRDKDVRTAHQGSVLERPSDLSERCDQIMIYYMTYL